MDKRFLAIYVSFFSLLILFFSENLSALMPPHIESSFPEYKGYLLGNTVRFYGYSLYYGDTEPLSVVDLTTANVVPASIDVRCASEGRGDAPGCVQSKCILSITLNENIPGHEYEISFIDTHIGTSSFPESIFRFYGSDEDPGDDLDLDGVTDKQGDCNDNDPEIYPGAAERCGNDVDRNCDGVKGTECCDSDSSVVAAGCFLLIRWSQ